MSLPEYQGRKTLTPGFEKISAWAAAKFKEWGLQPAGDNGTWFQNLAYGPSAFDVSKTTMVAAGKALTLKSDFLPLVPNAAAGIGSKAVKKLDRDLPGSVI